LDTADDVIAARSLSLLLKSPGWTRLIISPPEPHLTFKELQDEVDALQTRSELNDNPDGCLSYIVKRLAGKDVDAALVDLSRPTAGRYRLVDSKEDELTTHIGVHAVRSGFVGFHVSYDTISIPTTTLPMWATEGVRNSSPDPDNNDRTIVDFTPFFHRQCVNIDAYHLLTVLGSPLRTFDPREFAAELKTNSPHLLLDEAKTKCIPKKFTTSKDILWVTWTAGPTGWYIKTIVDSMRFLSKTFRSFYESEFEKKEGISLSQHHTNLAEKMRAPSRNLKVK
jgi:hypothetical protein